MFGYFLPLSCLCIAACLVVLYLTFIRVCLGFVVYEPAYRGFVHVQVC